MLRRRRLTIGIAAAAYAVGGAILTAVVNPGPALGRLAERLALTPVSKMVFPNVGLGERRIRVLLELGANVALFAPFGFIAAAWWARLRLVTIVLLGLALSAGIEVLQLLMHAGRQPDLRDVISNGVGTALGAILSRALYRDPAVREET